MKISSPIPGRSPSVLALALQSWDERLTDLGDPIFEEVVSVTALAMQNCDQHLWNGSYTPDSRFQERDHPVIALALHDRIEHLLNADIRRIPFLRKTHPP
jgi:hypothetical protein